MPTCVYETIPGYRANWIALPFEDNGFWAQVLDAFTPLHFGTFGGLPVKILWCLGGLTPAILAISGSLMWWKRKLRARVSQAAAQVPQATASTTG